MRIATYNIWNAPASNHLRFDQIAEQLKCINADVIGLQEVPDKEYHNQLLHECRYAFSIFHPHKGEEEGLSFFSNYPILMSRYVDCALIVTLKTENSLCAIANLHLDWKSALRREKEIISIERAVSSCNANYRFLLGDFNCSACSNVQQYLLGQSTLMGEETNPYWFDLAESYADISQIPTEATLDFRSNPRWQGKNTIETNQRFDRILLQNTYPSNLPTLEKCGVFGKKISAQSNLAPSDHYGIFADINFD